MITLGLGVGVNASSVFDDLRDGDCLRLRFDMFINVDRHELLRLLMLKLHVFMYAT
jgi:hypothetical protein